MNYKLNYNKSNKLLIFNNLAIRHNALFIKSDITKHDYSRFIQIIKNFKSVGATSARKRENKIKPIFVLSSDNKLTYYIGGYKDDLDKYNKNNIISIEAEFLQLTDELIIEYYDNIINNRYNKKDEKDKENKNEDNDDNDDKDIKNDKEKENDDEYIEYTNDIEDILKYQYIISDEKYLNNFNIFNDDIKNNIKICDKKVLNYDFIKRNGKWIKNYFPVEGIVRIQNINYNCGNWRTIAKWYKDIDDIQNFILYGLEFDLIDESETEFLETDEKDFEIKFDDINNLDDNVYDTNGEILEFDIKLDE